jgi:hypothetical protein
MVAAIIMITTIIMMIVITMMMVGFGIGWINSWKFILKSTII